MMLTMELYVPPIVKKKPVRMTKIHQATIKHHRRDFFCRPGPQLSYSHIHPIGWKHNDVARRAPTSDTRSLKTGMLLATIYATEVTVKVDPSHTIQWVRVWPVRCLVPRRMRIKMCLAGNLWDVSYVGASVKMLESAAKTHMKHESGGDSQPRKSESVADLLDQDPRRTQSG